MSGRELDRLRFAIDEIDRVIVKLLNQRARYALQVGEAKMKDGRPIYSPERERDVIENVSRANEGPLSPDGLRRLYERIIDESRRIEREAASNERGESC
jgi:chorismate mutase